MPKGRPQNDKDMTSRRMQNRMLLPRRQCASPGRFVARLCFRSGRRRSRARAAPQKLPATWQYQRRRGGDHDVPKGAPLRERFACGVRVALRLGSSHACAFRCVHFCRGDWAHIPENTPPRASSRTNPLDERECGDDGAFCSSALATQRAAALQFRPWRPERATPPAPTPARGNKQSTPKTPKTAQPYHMSSCHSSSGTIILLWQKVIIVPELARGK